MIGALKNSSIDWMLLQSLPIKNHQKPPTTVKRQNKAKYLTWNSIRFAFLKKTSMHHTVPYVMYHLHVISSVTVWVATRLKALSVPSQTPVRRSAVDQEDINHTRNQKRVQTSQVINPYYLCFFSKILLATEWRLTGQ